MYHLYIHPIPSMYLYKIPLRKGLKLLPNMMVQLHYKSIHLKQQNFKSIMSLCTVVLLCKVLNFNTIVSFLGFIIVSLKLTFVNGIFVSKVNVLLIMFFNSSFGVRLSIILNALRYLIQGLMRINGLKLQWTCCRLTCL